MSVDLTDDLIDKIITYFGSGDDPYDVRRVWEGLCFMEANGLDLALRYHEIHGHLISQGSPIPDASHLTHEDEERIVIRLRERIRRQLGLPALTNEEKAAWHMAARPQYVWRGDQMQSKKIRHIFSRGIKPDKIRDEVAREVPDLLRALDMISVHNATCRNDWNKQVSVFWLLQELVEVIVKLYPAVGQADIHDLAQYIIDSNQAAAETAIDGIGKPPIYPSSANEKTS